MPLQQQFPISRRQMLQRTGTGFGILGLAGALHAAGLLSAADVGAQPLGILGAPHIPPRAKRVIFLFMNGGPSQVDTFDPKPALEKYAGSPPPAKRDRTSNSHGGWLPSPFEFAPRGQSGVVMSELFPRMAQVADDLCVIRSMYTDNPNHEPGLLMMNCGNQQPIRPSLGAWTSYGLGTENQNLPSFLALAPGRPVVGPQLWSNSFLPGQHQGTSVDTHDLDIDRMVANLKHPTLSRDEQRRQLDLLLTLNRQHLAQRQDEALLDEQIKAMELAYQMQTAASEAFDVSREPEHVRDAYGRSPFGQGCLLARRLSERGVRFVQVYYVMKNGNQPWDTHDNNNDRHRELCADSDRATAALLGDLKARGLLEDTLVVWTGEFGRTPYAEVRDSKNLAKAGRDHHSTGFSTLLAGGGVKGGCTYGATDEFGMNAIENRVHVHDLHATILHLLGIDHERLTYRYSGRDFRLTDVHGRVVHEIIS